MRLLLHPQVYVFILVLLHHHLPHYVRILTVPHLRPAAARHIVVYLDNYHLVILTYILINDLSSELHIIGIGWLLLLLLIAVGLADTVAPVVVQTLLQLVMRVADLILLFLTLTDLSVMVS